MKTKKTLIAVLTATLIVTAFVIGCNVQLDNTDSDNWDKTAPEGKTKVRLNLASFNSKARTLAPSSASFPTSLTDFDHFILEIYDETNLASVTPNSPFDGDFYETDLTSDTLTVELATGADYTFTIIGYKSATEAIAIGILKEENISAAATLSITLKEIVNGTGTGTFAWTGLNTTFLDPVAGGALAYTTATLTLTNLGAGASPSPATLTAANGSLTPVSGYYKMVIQLGRADYQTVYVQDIVYIYAGFTTTYSGPLPALRSTKHVLTYNYGKDANPVPASETRTTSISDINHGTVVSAVSGHVAIPTYEDNISATDTYVFEKWYKTGTAPYYTTDLSDPLVATDRVLGPMTLYAGWILLTDVNVSIELDVAFTEGFTPTITPTVTSFTHGSYTLNIQLAVSPASGYDVIKWYKDTSPTVLIGNTSIINIGYTLDNTNVDWWQAGDHYVYLELSSSTNALPPQGGTVKITCNP